MEFKIEDYTVNISNNVLNLFEKHFTRKNIKEESGGILLGETKGKYMNISMISMPNIFDFSDMHNFIRDRNAAQIIINHEFLNSNGHTIYFGEWHTHNEDNPIPSHKDYRMIEEQYRNNHLNIEIIMLLILGLKNIHLGIFDGETYKYYAQPRPRE